MLKLKRSAFQPQGVALSQPQLDAVIDAHQKFVKGAGGAQATLRMADLHGLNLSQRTLREADFTGANLAGAELWGSILEKANFYCADLRGANFAGAILRYADLRGAHLSGAILNHALLDGADMRAASLGAAPEDAELSAELVRSDRPSAGADCSNCSMRGARLTDANLAGVDFSGAILEGADLRGAQLTDAVFDGAILTAVPVHTLGFSKEQLSNCVVDPSQAALDLAPRLLKALEEAGAWVASDGRSGAPAILDGQDLRPIGQALAGRNLVGLSVKGGCAVGVDFSGCSLEGANFDGADLRGAKFEGANLRGASFRNAKLSHARFKGAILQPLVLPDGRHHHPNFSDAVFAGADFSAIVGKSPLD